VRFQDNNRCEVLTNVKTGLRLTVRLHSNIPLRFYTVNLARNSTPIPMAALTKIN
jgi:hypothetical protein